MESPVYIGGQQGSIYLITNTVTGKMYVGQTTLALHDRWRHHIKRAGEWGNGLAEDVHKHGASKFSIIELTRVPVEYLDDMEKFYIQQYSTLSPIGYNLTEGGKSFVRSDTTKDRLSRSKTRIKFTDTPKPMRNTSRGIRKPNNYSMKPVIGVHMDTGEVIEMPAVSARPEQFDPRLVSACCRGKRKYHRNYRWSYAT